MRGTIIRTILVVGLVLALTGAVATVLAGLGSRWGWWHFSTGFTFLRWGVYASLAAAAASVLALLSAVLTKRRRLALAALPGIVIAATVIAVPLDQWRRAAEAPPIHDISTDLDDPPVFVALRGARQAAPNAVDHPGEATARMQREAYPELEPVRLAAERNSVFAAAEAVARDLGWRIAEADPAEGRIEAVDRTFWFGFRDDVVVRITGAEDGGTRVDVRSASRVGRGDLGTNARRIRDFLARLQERVQAPGG